MSASVAAGLGLSSPSCLQGGGLATNDKRVVRFALHRRVRKRSWPSSAPPEVVRGSGAGRLPSAASRERGGQERLGRRVEAHAHGRRPRASGSCRAAAPGRGTSRSRKAKRVSSRVASQVAALQKAAADMGVQLPRERCYVDEGFSGARLDRPAFDAMRDAAAAGRAATARGPERRGHRAHARRLRAHAAHRSAA